MTEPALHGVVASAQPRLGSASIKPDRGVVPATRVLARALLVLALYVGVAIYVTWPLGLHLGSHLPHDLGDPLISAWHLWWHHAVVPFTEEWWRGLAFWPASDTLTFSDHRVGLAMISTPLLLVGGNEIAAYNLALLASFAGSAAATHVLIYSLTKQHATAFVGALIFGFNPFRLPHVVHLEIVSSYWLPLSLACLHRWLETRTVPWALAAAASFLLQALTCGYYLFFGSVLLGGWAVWFLRSRPGAQVARLAGVCGVVLSPLGLILWRYYTAHERFGYRRAIWEIEELSADVTGLISGSPLTAGQPWFESLRKPEGDIFPGLVALTILAVAWVRGTRRSKGYPRVTLGRTAAVCLTACFVAVAASALILGAWQADVAGVRLSVSGYHKPLSVALLCVTWLGLTSRTFRSAWTRQSIVGFYAVGTVACWVLAFGPSPTALGHQILYKAPYSWLMWLPGFDGGLRAPARFAMPAALCLAVVVGVSLWNWLRDRRGLRVGVCSLLSAAVLFESTPRTFPLVEVPPPLSWPSNGADSVRLELPLGVEEDARAVYGTVHHRLPVVNGLSGYYPPHYVLLMRAFEIADPAGILALSSRAPLLVAIRRDREKWRDYFSQVPEAKLEASRADADYYTLPRTAGTTAAPYERVRLPVDAVRVNGTVVGAITDGRLDTVWHAGDPSGEQVTVRLPSSEVCAVEVSQGRAIQVPDSLSIEAHSAAGRNVVWQGPVAGRAAAAAMNGQLSVTWWVPVALPRGSTGLTLRRTTPEDLKPWSVAELALGKCIGR